MNSYGTIPCCRLAPGSGFAQSLVSGRCLLLLAVSLIASCLPPSPPKTSLATPPAAELEVRVEYTPFKTSTAQFIVLKSGGQMRSFQFSPYQLLVTAVAEGTISKSEVTALLHQLQDHAIAEAFRKKDYSGVGLSRGDQAHLAVLDADGSRRECLGFVEDMPQEVQSLLQKFRKQMDGLPATTMAEAYLRSQPIPSNRLAIIQQQGKLRVWKLTELPREMQSLLQTALENPALFYPLGKSQYEQLLAFNSSQAELYVTHAGRGGKLSLFSRRN
jgi:hypothetical protein